MSTIFTKNLASSTIFNEKDEASSPNLRRSYSKGNLSSVNSQTNQRSPLGCKNQN